MPIARRGLLRAAIAVPALALLPACTRAPEPAPMARNLLFIMVDDLNLAIGCWGHPIARTPNLDRLAARGLRFSHAFCTYPLCGPSRAACLTGRRPEHLGMNDNEVCWRARNPGLRTLPEIAWAAGFESVRFGKILHHGLPPGGVMDPAEGADRPHTFTDPPSWEREWGGSSTVHERHVDGPTAVIDGPAFGGSGLHTVRARGGSVLPDAEVADRAVEFLHGQGRGRRPFMLSVGFHKPHVPLIAPERWWACYDAIPDAGIDACMGPTAIRAADLPAGALKSMRPHRGATVEQRRHLYRGYLACVSWMDEQLGRVLDALSAAGLADDTLVAFVGDHGYHIGEQGQWDKMMLLDPSLRIPVMLAGPGIPVGRTSSALIESISLFPTLCRLLGLDPAQSSDGEDLAPLIADPSAEWHRPARAWMDAGGRSGRTVRTRTHRYAVIKRGDGPEHDYLFDLERDPWESRNIIADPEQAAVRLQMRGLLGLGA